MAEKRPWIAYVAPVAFPEGGAAARRILGNAKALVAAGYQVVIVSGQRPSMAGTDVELAPHIRCVSVNERDAEHLPNILRYARYALMGSRSRQWLDAQDELPRAIILYSGYSPYLLQFTGWARRSGVALLFDAVEWYAAPTPLRFLLSPYLWNSEFAMRVLIPRLDGVIAISRALEHYYRKRGVLTTRVPPLIDPAEFAASAPAVDPDGCMRLVYSGTPGRKDLIDIIIEAVISCDDGSGRLRLEIVGPSAEELRNRAPLRRRGGVIPDCLVAHGQVSHGRSMEIVGQADFTIFLRHPNRVSTHGFPTKFVESCAVGTPVIANITSDLEDHLRDGETGLVCPVPTQAGIEATLARALVLHRENPGGLRKAVRNEAERAFGLKNFTAAISDLVSRASEKFTEKRTEQ